MLQGPRDVVRWIRLATRHDVASLACKVAATRPDHDDPMTSTYDRNSLDPTPVVDRLLAAIRGGDLSAADQLYTPGTVLDAVVPGWRFGRVGDEAIRDEYSR